MTTLSNFGLNIYSARNELRRVVPLAFFTKKYERVELNGLKGRFQWAFNRSPKKVKKVFSVSESLVYEFTFDIIFVSKNIKF